MSQHVDRRIVAATVDGREKRAEAGREKRAEAHGEWKRAQLSLNECIGEKRVGRLHAMTDECFAAMDEPLAG